MLALIAVRRHQIGEPKVTVTEQAARITLLERWLDRTSGNRHYSSGSGMSYNGAVVAGASVSTGFWAS